MMIRAATPILDDAAIAAVLAQVVMLAEASAAAHRELAAIATPVEFTAGTALVRQGEPGDALYVIVAGRLDVLLDLESGEQRTLSSLGPGDCVGEMALLTKHARSATVVARTPAIALRIAESEFAEVLARHPALRAHVCRPC